MFQDWALAHKGCGVIVQNSRGDVTVLEFNEFLGRMASGRIGPDDIVLSEVMTDGVLRRAGDLRLYAQVTSGRFQTESLPRRVPGGLLATGRAAEEEFRAVANLSRNNRPNTCCSSIGPSHIGRVVLGLLALVGFGLLCSLRPGTPGHGPTSTERFRPSTHPLHPPFLPR